MNICKIGSKSHLIEMGVRLIKVRKLLGFSIDDVAFEVGITAEHYSKIEYGLKKPAFLTFLKICSVLNCSLDFIVAGEYIDEYMKESSEYSIQDKEFLITLFYEFEKWMRKTKAQMIERYKN